MLLAPTPLSSYSTLLLAAQSDIVPVTTREAFRARLQASPLLYDKLTEPELSLLAFHTAQVSDMVAGPIYLLKRQIKQSDRFQGNGIALSEDIKADLQNDFFIDRLFELDNRLSLNEWQGFLNIMEHRGHRLYLNYITGERFTLDLETLRSVMTPSFELFFSGLVKKHELSPLRHYQRKL